MSKGMTIDFKLGGKEKRGFVPQAVCLMYSKVDYFTAAKEYLKVAYPGCKTTSISVSGGKHSHDLTEVTELPRTGRTRP